MPRVHFGAEQDLQLLGILAALGGLLVLAPVLRLPLPILLVAGGILQNARRPLAGFGV